MEPVLIFEPPEPRDLLLVHTCVTQPPRPSRHLVLRGAGDDHGPGRAHRGRKDDDQPPPLPVLRSRQGHGEREREREQDGGRGGVGGEADVIFEACLVAAHCVHCSRGASPARCWWWGCCCCLHFKAVPRARGDLLPSTRMYLPFFFFFLLSGFFLLYHVLVKHLSPTLSTPSSRLVFTRCM